MNIGGEKDPTAARLKKVKFCFLTEKKVAGYSNHPVPKNYVKINEMKSAKITIQSNNK